MFYLKEIPFTSFLTVFSIILFVSECKSELDHEALKERVKRIFYHSYNGYLENAYPLDELRPLSCDGQETWGSFSLTLVDSLDTLIVLGNYTEFRRVVELVLSQLNPNKNVNVSVFETNIRVVGGLLSAHLLSKKAGLITDSGWPCHGKLLQLAERFASKILPAFNTPTGMPYGTVNLALGGVPKKETPITCVATIGTCILEFGTLSRLTGDLRYEDAAIRAVRSLWSHRSELGLVGNHINVLTGEWVGKEATIGAGVDSYFEYLLKGAIMFRLPELDAMFREYRDAIKKYLKFGSWHFMVNMGTSSVTSPIFQSLDAFWPGVLAMAGEIDEAKEFLVQYHKVWKKYGFLPEMYDVVAGKPIPGRAAYPLRPEFIESVLHLYRATRDPYLLEVGVDVLNSIETVAKTKCGFATVNNVRTHLLENRMESFFLSETIKYLYLLFDTENFLHDVPSERVYKSHVALQNPPDIDHIGLDRCSQHSGGYIFNTEAHPLDSGLIHCCSIQRAHELEKIAALTNLQLISDIGLPSDMVNFLQNALDTDNDADEERIVHESIEAVLLQEVDRVFLGNLESSLLWNGSSSQNYKSTDTLAVEVGNDEWIHSLWQDMKKLINMPLTNEYPANYTPPLLQRSPPLFTCPVLPFTAQLHSLQDMDLSDLD